MAGLACVVSNVGGNLEIISNGVTGMVVQRQDSALYAAALRQLLEKPEWMADFQKAVKRDVAQRFSKEYMAEKVREVYENCSG